MSTPRPGALTFGLLLQSSIKNAYEPTGECNAHSMAGPTTQEAEDLYGCEKWIVDDVQWVPDGKFRYVKVPVLTQLGETLMLRGTAGRKYSFNLLYRDHYPIRRWDFDHRGRDVDIRDAAGVVVKVVSIPDNAAHKHRWDEEMADRDIYLVHDIPLDNVNQAFHGFLEESKIKLQGAYYPVF